MRMTEVLMPGRLSRWPNVYMTVARQSGQPVVVFTYHTIDDVVYISWSLPGRDFQRFTKKRLNELQRVRTDPSVRRSCLTWSPHLLADGQVRQVISQVYARTCDEEVFVSTAASVHQIGINNPKLCWDQELNQPVVDVRHGPLTLFKGPELTDEVTLIGRSGDLLWHCTESGRVTVWRVYSLTQSAEFSIPNDKEGNTLVSACVSDRWMVTSELTSDLRQQFLRLAFFDIRRGEQTRVMKIPLPHLRFHYGIPTNSSFIVDESVCHVFLGTTSESNYRGRGSERSTIGLVVSVDMDD